MALPQDEVLRLHWRKAKRSMSNGNCTEVTVAADFIVVRDSQDPCGPILRYPARSWRSFVQDARMGKFDVSGRNNLSGLSAPRYWPPRNHAGRVGKV
jgi:hypothetical protein